MGCEVSYWEMEEVYCEEVKGYKPVFSLEKLKEIVREDTKLVIVNFPHNPTGFLPS